MSYALIRTTPGTVQGTLDELKKIPQVKEAHIIYGIYDVLIKVEAETVGALEELLLEKVRRIKTISSTVTMVVVE